MESHPGDEALAVRSIRLHQSPGSAAPVLHTPHCSGSGGQGVSPGGEGSCPDGRIWNLPQAGSGAHTKDPFRQNCDKVS